MLRTVAGSLCFVLAVTAGLAAAAAAAQQNGESEDMRVAVDGAASAIPLVAEREKRDFHLDAGMGDNNDDAFADAQDAAGTGGGNSKTCKGKPDPDTCAAKRIFLISLHQGTCIPNR